jgi:DNA polymerase III sliding clamp (beta) subunit (PCNA family)
VHQVTLVVDGEALVSAVELCNSVVPSRTPMESLKNILIQSSDGIMTLSAGDSETSVRAMIAESKEAHAEFAVLASTLKSVLSDCGGEVQIAITDRVATFRTALGTYKLPLAILDGMVPSVGFDSTDYVTADLARLRQALACASRCVSEVKGGAALSNVFIDPRPNKGHVAATDTRRILIADVLWEPTGNPSIPDPTVASESQVLLSVSACSVIQKLQGATVDAVFLPNMAIFRAGTVVVSCKLSVGRFPNIMRFLAPPPGSMSTQCNLVAGPLLNLVNRVRVVTTEESRKLIFEFGPESLTASSSSEHLGEAESSIPISLQGASVVFATNPVYMADFLSRVDKSASVRIGLKDHEHAMYMDVESLGWRYAVMPIVLEVDA